MVAPPSTGVTSASSQRPNGRPTDSQPPNTHNANAPLSARRAAPLDMSTVERRGQSTAVREPAKRVRPNGLQEAPTFRPTEEEWKEPMEYMKKITPEGQKYGICKIIPPESWNPPFAIDTEVRSSGQTPDASAFNGSDSSFCSCHGLRDACSC